MELNARHDSNTLCRACLNELDNLKYDIFLTPDFVKKLVLCTSMTVEPQDGYPKHLCECCYAKVNELHQFQRMCVKSAERFRELLLLHETLDNRNNVELTFDDEKPVFDLEANTKVEITVAESTILFNEEGNIVFNGLATDELQNSSVDRKTKKNRRRRGRPAKRKAFEKIKVKDPTESADEVSPQKRRRHIVNLTKDVVLYEVETSDDSDRDFSNNELNSIEAQLQSDKEDTDSPLAKQWSKTVKTKTDVIDSNSSSILHKRKCSQRNSKNRSSSAGRCVSNKDTTKSSVFQCDICPTRFFAEHRLIAHKRSHDGLVPYPCPHDDCDRAFNRFHCFSEHLKQHEGTNRWYACTEPNCEKVYKHKPTLAMHLRKFHKRGPELKSHICEICGKVFKASAILNDHRYIHKDKSELPYACEQAPHCQRRFSNKEKLKVHMLRHAGIKNFVCPYCGMRKTTRNELKIHINYHTLERTWPCRFCAHVCNSAGNLKMHVRTVHERAKDYACRYCERTFAKPDTRKYHEMTHTGEKPNECAECGKRFTQPAALRTHRKIHQRHRLQTATATTTSDDRVATPAAAAEASVALSETPLQQQSPVVVLQQQVVDTDSNLHHLLQAASSI